jgi:hypothetical protein
MVAAMPIRAEPWRFALLGAGVGALGVGAQVLWPYRWYGIVMFTIGASLAVGAALSRPLRLWAATLCATSAAIIGFLIAYYFSPLSRFDFDDPAAWTVSFQCGPFAIMPMGSTISFQALHCMFTNASKTQRRIIDVLMEIPLHDDKIRTAELDTARTDNQVYADFLRQSRPKDLGRRSNPLANPIVIEPSSVVEGFIEFAVTPDVAQRYAERQYPIDFFDLDHKTVKVTEHISGHTISVSGLKYDAVSGTKLP